MTKWKIGLVVLGLISAIGCGDSGGGDDGADNGGANSSANANDGANAGDDAGGTTAGGTDAGGTTAGGTDAGRTTAGGADAGSTTGVAGTGACTNAADKAIVDAASLAKLGCEGGICVGSKGIGFDLGKGAVVVKEPETAMCVAKDAPTLSKLSAACQACFTAISVCVPRSCVKALGAKVDACGGTPSTDFKTCDKPTAATAECAKCSKDNCESAFSACSGLN